MSAWEGFGQPDGLFRRLRAASAAEWAGYTWHPFCRGLADGSLPIAAFRHYLIQDFLFLVHFARAEALAVFKAESIAAMREKTAAIGAILAETTMHLGYCAEWGLSEATVLAATETEATVAYTRYVIDCGLRGDILDLEVALAPCTVGYAEVALRIEADPARRRDGNPYESWIAAYAGADYQALARAAALRIDALGESHGGVPRFAALSAIFGEAARLEQRFWQQGFDAA